MKTSTLATLRQYLAATAASISVIVLGTALGWPSPVLPKIQSDGQPFPMSSEEISWMVSLLYIGNMLSPLPAGHLMDTLGRKKALMVLSVIPLSSWVIIFFATGPYLLYIARFLSGMWSGIVSTIAPMYLAEISEPKIRGALSTFVQLMTNLGVLTEYVIGPPLSYKALAGVSGLLPIIFVFVFWWMPESPYWQVMKNKNEEAAKSLAWLRGQKTVKGIEDELHLVQHAVQEEMRNKGRFRDLVATSGNKRALLIVEMLALTQRMSGISALMAFTSTTLPPNGVLPLTPNDCVVIMGLVWVASVFIATFLVDSLGRRPLLLFSTISCGVAMFAAGLWFFLDSMTTVDVSELAWIPFASFLLYGLGFCMGLGPIASTVQGEAFSSNIKGKASGVTSIVLAGTSFVMNKIYHPIERYLGMYLNYWIFAAACLGATLFIIFYMIETKGKTLHEIQQELEKHKKNKNEKVSENTV